jgi:hypothetical protein
VNKTSGNVYLHLRFFCSGFPHIAGAPLKSTNALDEPGHYTFQPGSLKDFAVPFTSRFLLKDL